MGVYKISAYSAVGLVAIGMIFGNDDDTEIVANKEEVEAATIDSVGTTEHNKNEKIEILITGTDHLPSVGTMGRCRYNGEFVNNTNKRLSTAYLAFEVRDKNDEYISEIPVVHVSQLRAGEKKTYKLGFDNGGDLRICDETDVLKLTKGEYCQLGGEDVDDCRGLFLPADGVLSVHDAL